MPQPLPDTRARLVIGDDEVLAGQLLRSIQSVVDTRGTGGWSIAISGGSVAERLLPPLAQAPLPWSRASVFFVDERAVPSEDPASNWHVCRTAAALTPMGGAWWHRMRGESADLRSASAAYMNLLASILDGTLELDVVLLGVGEDGHVASLFPGRSLSETGEATIGIETESPKPPRVRLSMTMPLLTRARLTCLAAFGTSKREAMRAALEMRRTIPAGRVIADARVPLVLMDELAAGPR